MSSKKEISPWAYMRENHAKMYRILNYLNEDAQAAFSDFAVGFVEYCGESGGGKKEPLSVTLNITHNDQKKLGQISEALILTKKEQHLKHLADILREANLTVANFSLLCSEGEHGELMFDREKNPRGETDSFYFLEIKIIY